MTDIKIKQVSHERSDGIADFDVILLKPHMKVKDLFNYILNESNTWGKVYFINDSACDNPHYANFDLQEMLVEYRHGEVVKSRNALLFIEIEGMNLKTVKAQGGYSRMDYYFTLKESVNV